MHTDIDMQHVPGTTPEVAIPLVRRRSRVTLDEDSLSELWTYNHAVGSTDDALDLDDDEPIGIPRTRLRPWVARVFGWALVATAIYFMWRIAASEPARREIAEWGSFGLAEYVRRAIDAVIRLVDSF